MSMDFKDIVYNGETYKCVGYLMNNLVRYHRATGSWIREDIDMFHGEINEQSSHKNFEVEGILINWRS